MESLTGILYSVGFSHQQIRDFRKAGFRTTSDVLCCDPEQVSQKAALPYAVIERIRKKILGHVQPGVSADTLFLALSSRRNLFPFGIPAMDDAFPAKAFLKPAVALSENSPVPASSLVYLRDYCPVPRTSLRSLRSPGKAVKLRWVLRQTGRRDPLPLSYVFSERFVAKRIGREASQTFPVVLWSECTSYVFYCGRIVLWGRSEQIDSVIEICGAPLSGKSDMCCGICLEAAFANRPSLYIDTSGQFGAERLKGIMQRWGCKGPQIMDTLERIYVLRVTEVFRLLQLLDFLLSWKVDQKDPTARKPEIVVIDSVYSVLGPWMGGKIDQGYSLMNQLAFALKNVAVTLDIPVIYTNHMPTARSGAVQEANLGIFWQSVPHERIGLQNVETPNETVSDSETQKKGKRLRRAVLMKSTDQEIGATAQFFVSRTGAAHPKPKVFEC